MNAPPRSSRAAALWTVAIILAGLPLAVRAQSTTSPTTAPAASAPATEPAPTPPASTDPKVLALLDMLHDRDATLHDFHADVETLTKHSRTDEVDIHRGTVDYVKDATQDQTKFAIHFTVAGTDDAYHKIDQDLVFDGTDLIDRKNDQKQYKVIHLSSPDKHVNPLKLGEGPLPLPIGQSSAEIQRQFVVTLIDQDPAKQLSHLKLVPRHAGAFDFTQLDLWVDESIQLPTRMQTISTDGDPTTITLKNVQINHGTAKIFSIEPPTPNTGWQITSDDPAAR
jgi:hypothetical protein